MTSANADEIDGLVDLADELLPLLALANGPATDLGLGLDYQADFCLQLIVQRLKDFPGRGWMAIQIALRNRVVGARNGALNALEHWSRDEWPDEVVATLRNLQWREPNDAVRRRMRLLADGAEVT